MYTYIMHANRNHDPKTGQFTNGDGDGDGIIDDHHNQGKDGSKKKKKSTRTITVNLNYSKRPKNERLERMKRENSVDKLAIKKEASLQKLSRLASNSEEVERIRQENKTARSITKEQNKTARLQAREAAKLQKQSIDNARKDAERFSKQQYAMKKKAISKLDRDYDKALKNIEKGIKKTKRGKTSAAISLLTLDPIGLASSVALMNSGSQYVKTNQNALSVLNSKMYSTQRLIDMGNEYMNSGSYYTNAYDSEIDKLKSRGFITNA